MVVTGKVTNLVAVAVTTAEGDQVIETDVTVVDSKGKGTTFRVRGGDLNGLTLRASYEQVPKKGENMKVHLAMKNGHYRLEHGQQSVEK
jgi:hypothetical protein